MKIERKTAADGDVTILAFTGEFDAFNLPTISEKIDTLISKGCTRLVFNLHLLKFINSSALGYLIKTHKRLKQLDGELVLSQPSKFFQTTIATLGIDQIFKIYAGDSEAVSYFAESGVAQLRYGARPIFARRSTFRARPRPHQRARESGVVVHQQRARRDVGSLGVLASAWNVCGKA